jgi:flagellar hook protein FlgE
MNSQSRALEAIGANVANVTTNGYKRSEINFGTLVSRTWSSPGNGEVPSGSTHSDMGGVRAKTYNRISDQGQVRSTGGGMDLALLGRGLFIYNTEVGGGGAELYGRDGAFGTAVGGQYTATDPDGTTYTSNETYLVDGNGYYVQGWRAAPDGSFSADAGGLSSIRLDPGAFSSAGQPTTRADLSLNLPADLAPGQVNGYAMDVFDSAGDSRSVELRFAKTAPNTWDLNMTGGSGDTVTFAPAAPLTFDALGALGGPTQYAVNIAHAGGSASNFILDIAGFTQFAGPLMELDYDRDGFPPGQLASVEFDAGGVIHGLFSNGQVQPLYRLGIGNVPNPDGLRMLSGNVFTLSEDSGALTVGVAGEGGLGEVIPESVEQSNVELADEFTRMIMTQRAYSSSATVFKTVDEMLQTAAQLKR